MEEWVNLLPRTSSETLPQPIGWLLQGVSCQLYFSMPYAGWFEPLTLSALRLALGEK